jgi:peptidyl-prolyl cis-trans isomerase A (cyclophilin A)
MKILMLVCSCLLIFNCEDKHSNQKTNASTQDSTKIKNVSKADSVIAPEKEFKRLTDDNALYFFQEYDKKHNEDKVRITTDFGTIEIQLFPETLYHRANFIYLTKRHYFDGTQFYRVVPNFVIQGGNSDDVEVGEKRRDIGSYLLPPDTKKGFKHDRGIISMPSSEIDDAYKMASPYQFFIVQGANGAHHLDGQYTAFGKVIDGMEVVDKIAAQKTDDSEWPLHNIYIRKVEIIK